MKLSDYLEKRKITQTTFASLIGVKAYTVSRYLDGRVPSKSVVEEIWKITSGAVQPNDFYDAPKARKK